ncbi:hypothetical protein [Pyramidobacter porci]
MEKALSAGKRNHCRQIPVLCNPAEADSLKLKMRQGNREDPFRNIQILRFPYERQIHRAAVIFFLSVTERPAVPCRRSENKTTNKERDMRQYDPTAS